MVSSDTETDFLLQSDGERIAYARRTGSKPGIVWLGGFKSDMEGTKAKALDAWCAARSQTYVRFDYFGHGKSSGAFRDGTVTRWRDNCVAVLDHLTEGPQILVGSSMGAWLAILTHALRPGRMAGILLIAPAIDFTEALMWARLPEQARHEILTKGVWLRPSAYDVHPYEITRQFIEDGRRHLLLGGTPLAIDCPVRILQGQKDPDVPWTHALKLVDAIAGDVRITLVKNGDHRLSTPSDIRLLERTLEGLIEDIET
jgi:pimeloyl-ACP methyl ester carboxylesterase